MFEAFLEIQRYFVYVNLVYIYDISKCYYKLTLDKILVNNSWKRKEQKMKRILTAMAITGLAFFSGCGGGSPIPSSPDKKPTVYVHSHTAEKFKNITKANAIWNGISPQLIKDKQYMRCDMSEEAMAVFSRRGFELVAAKEEADYTFDVTLVSCGSGHYKNYLQNKTEIPLHERAIYKDLMQFSKEGDPEKFPSGFKEIVELISQNNEKGFEMFQDANLLWKIQYTEKWDLLERHTKDYLKKYKVVLANKYYGIKDEDIKALKELSLKMKKKLDSTGGTQKTGADMIGKSASILSNPAAFGKHGGSFGGAMMGVGVLMSFMGTMEPVPVNMFTITNNRTAKSWSQEMRFSIDPQSWESNIKKPMDDWLIDEIPWKEIN